MTPGAVFVDSAAFVALVSVRDAWHDAAKAVMAQLAREQRTLLTSENSNSGGFNAKPETISAQRSIATQNDIKYPPTRTKKTTERNAVGVQVVRRWHRA